MTERRFTVRWLKVNGSLPGRRDSGWCVFDRGRAITITFATEAEALQRRDNIQKIYARWGW